jgi:8-oxo-dGTP pyrophosphatase MutT (NUDIX family)
VTATPVEPRDAATVLLLRPGAQGPEVYVMVRQASMAFAGGMVAFPGGGVDAVDRAAVDPFLACAVREVAEETGVALTSSALIAWDAWTTPVQMPRRYRTWFYLAVLPPEAEAADISGEASWAGWVRPADALARVAAEEWRMLPPTYCSLLRLATFSSVEEAVAGCGAVEMFLPDHPGHLPAWATAMGAVLEADLEADLEVDR